MTLLMMLWGKGWPAQAVYVVCALLCGVLQGGLLARAGVGWDCQGSRTWPQGRFRPQRSPSADAIMPAKVRSKSLLACLCTSALHLLRTNAMSIPARATRLGPRGPSGATRTPGLLLPKQARCLFATPGHELESIILENLLERKWFFAGFPGPVSQQEKMFWC